MKQFLVILFLFLSFNSLGFGAVHNPKLDQIAKLKKRIVELRKELKEAGKKYEESKSVSFEQYLGAAKGEGGDLKGKIHLMRNKMDYEEEKSKIKKRFEEIKEELKSSETKLMVLEA